MRRVIGLAFALVLLSAAPAFAHVSVNPSEVAEGGYAKLTFRVPNESDTESTVELEIVMPETAPFASVSVKPVPGWTADVARDGDTVTGITWTGGEIKPGEFQEFDISVGPVPEVDVLEFKALQTYSDGEIVRWIDPVVDGEDEPEHPAPTATVVEGSGEHGHDEAAAPEDDHEGEAAAEDEAATADDGEDEGEDGTDTAAFIALFVAGAALIAAIAALIFARKRPPA